MADVPWADSPKADAWVISEGANQHLTFVGNAFDSYAPNQTNGAFVALGLTGTRATLCGKTFGSWLGDQVSANAIDGLLVENNDWSQPSANHALLVVVGRNVVIRGNAFRNPWQRVIHITDRSDDNQTQDVLVENNTFIDSDWAKGAPHPSVDEQFLGGNEVVRFLGARGIFRNNLLVGNHEGNNWPKPSRFAWPGVSDLMPAHARRVGFQDVMRVILLVMVMMLAGCGSPPSPCGPSTCSGCCSAEGECVGGVTAQRCGARGNQCVSCPENESCNVGVCLPAFTPRPEEHFDAGATTEDSGVPDAGEADAGEVDAGAHDAGVSDAGAPDAGATDAGLPPDAGSRPVDAGVVVDAGTSDCAGTLAPCSGTCRDLRADVENCGSCGRVCGSGQVCNQGTCAPLPMDCTLATCGAGYSCDPLTRRCMAGCRLSTDCPMGATCQQGQCQCPSMNHACGQTCVSNLAVTSCGARCTTCPQPAANGVASCSVGACAFACNPGFVASGGSCVDVNECLVDNGGCGSSVTSSCTNTPGGRTCGCVTGYGSADGGVCSDVDECATNNGGCSSNATCTNTPGARTCACQPGWVGDGITCTRVSCATNNGGCDPNAVCTDTTTWPTCACGVGFEGDGQWCLASSSQKRWRSALSTPPQLYGFAMAYDPVRRRTVLFGGYGSLGRVNETWEFDGTTWTQRTLPGALPPARSRASMAFDPVRGVLVMAGGNDGRHPNVSTASRYDMGFMSDVWEYNGSAWVSVGFLPEARAYATLVFDTARNKLLLAGGVTRVWDGSRGVVTERFEDEVYERTGTSWARNPARLPR